MIKQTLSIALAVALGASATSAFAQTTTSPTLDADKAKGHVQCGVTGGVPGFSAPDANNNWTGLEVDYCRALAAAIFDNPDAVRYTPLTSQERFTALSAGEIDVLSRTTTWTMSRDTQLGISFVGHASEVREIKELAPELQTVSKIERTTALENLDEILEVTDGVMVARGDLGVEVELEQLPLAQKSLISAALRAGKFTITATEMLESMIHSSRPTRAEVSDCANAILDGSDAIMLSAETAVGAYPVEAVATMTEIALSIESSQRYHDQPRPAWREGEVGFANATALAAVQAQEALSLDLIAVFTESGNTARLLSSYRPHARIIALSPEQSSVNQMTILSAVHPILFRREPSIEDMLFMAAEMFVVRGLAEYGTEMVFVAGTPPGIARSTNVMKLHRIGEEVRLH